MPLAMVFKLGIAVRAGVAGADNDVMPYRSGFFLQSMSSPI